MTQPGSILYPQPGWWVRSNRVGVNTNLGFGWASNAVGLMNPTGQSTGGYGWSGVAHGIKTPPSFQAVGPASASGTSPVTFTDTAPTGTTCTLIWVSNASSSATPTISASFGSTSATLVGTIQVAAPSSHVFITCYQVLWVPLGGSPSGSKTVTFTGSGSAANVVNTAHYKGVSSVGTPVLIGAQTGQCSMAASSTNANYLYANAFTYAINATGNTFSAYGQSQRYLIAGTASTNHALVFGDAPGNGGTLTCTATRSNTTNTWGGMIVPLIT